jgi:hypothetical protein
VADLEDIVRGLTKAQADWFATTALLPDGRALGVVARFALPDGTVRYYSAERDALTPLGLEVRARLLSSSGEG